MSITQSMANAVSGLTATARMAEITSSNLSNVMTDGYGRRVVDLSAQQAGGRGAGVQVDGISRIVDRSVLSERRLAVAQVGFDQARSTSLGRLENAIGSIDDPDGLAGRVASLEATLSTAAGNPSNDLQLEDVLGRLQDVARALNDGQSAIMDLREQADSDIAAGVETLNIALGQVEALNGDIARARSQGNDTAALLDQRQRAIDSIAEAVPVREVDRGNGRVALMTSSGTMLLDGTAPRIGFAPAAVITPGMSLAGGALSGLTVNGAPVAGGTGAGGLGGGSLGAAFRLRDETLPEAQITLDAVARDLIERVQDPAIDPSLGAGAAGLFTDDGAAFSAADEAGIAGRIAVNAAVDPAQGGSLHRLRDGVGATAPGPVGDASQLTLWIAGLSEQRSLSTGGAADSVAGHATSLTSSIVQDRLRAEESVSYATGRYNAIRETELAGGVDTDQEMQMLLQIEQAYSANAKVIETADAMIRRLLEL